MKRARSSRGVLASLFAVLFAVASLAQVGVATAQTTTTGQVTSPQTAGTATITFSDAWEYDPDISDSETAFLSHTSIANTLYIYGEIVDATVTDPETAIDQFATGFFGAFGDKNEQIVANDTIDTDTVWRLYSVDQSGIPYGMLITANIAKVPGTVVVNVLLSPEGSFDLAVAATQSDIDINGTGSPVASFNGEDLATTLESGGTATGTTATAASTTPTSGGLTLPPLNQTPTVAAGGETPTQTTGGLTLPPLNQTPTQTTGTGGQTPTAAAGTTGQTVTVNAATITYAGNWTYEEAQSTPDQIAFFSNSTSDTTIFGYAAVADSSGDVSSGLQEFNDGFFGSFGATNVQQLTLEALPSGKAYSLYTAEQGSTPVAVLAYADSTTVPGEFRVQILIVAASDFDAVLSDVRQSFQIDSTGAFTELDPAALSTLLGGGTTTTTGQTTPTQTTGGLTLPPLNQTPTQATGTTGTTGTTGQVESVIVNGANVTYGPSWVYEADTSTPDQLAFFSHGTSQTSLFGYASINDVTATDAASSLQQFNDGFFGSFSATNVQQVSMETLPSGLAYSLFTAERSGVPIVVLMYADVTTVPGQFRVQIVMSEVSEFSTIFTDTRQSVQIDGVPAFNELDAATLTSLLGG